MDAPCNICGCTETNLVDGFYYCAECGTQDTNVRETIVEFVTLGDGVAALGTRRRVQQIPQAKGEEMTDDWYKWHSLNFLLKGLADELIEVGAAPSFKTKLLWVWTRYMKKYQNKADFGFAANEDSDENEQNEEDKATMNDHAYSSEDEDEETIQRQKKKIESNGDITKISMNLIMSFLYVALNLDKSHIQLTHLIRIIREDRISIMRWQKLIPQELRPKKLRNCLLLNYVRFKYSYLIVRVLSLELFRKLDLGNPVVPELRPLVDEYLRELCLPNDLQPLVISLIHYRSFDYLDVNVLYMDVRRMPSYELYVMAHILMALKICFGLDGDYEVKMSDAVDKINETEDHPKSYNSEPTERLFSFREWSSYIQFRKTLLRAHTLHLGAPNYFDMNDYVTFEHLNERPDYKKTLTDEIAMEIINKIPSGDINVIPRSDFGYTLKPHTSYTRVILEHQQDPNVKQLLSEDFTQYSLKYIMKDMFLVDIDSTNPQNILTGVSERNKVVCCKTFDVIDSTIYLPHRMVYVKDCDNHNWLVTQRPQLEHATNGEGDDKDNDHGYESNPETSQNFLNSKVINLESTQENVRDSKSNSTINLNNNSKIHYDINNDTHDKMDIDDKEQDDDVMMVDNSTTVDKGNYKIDKDIESLKIQEEVEGDSIFDDDFVDLDTKKEEPEKSNNDKPCETNEVFNIPDLPHYDRLTQEYRASYDSDNSSVDSIRFNPESLDRNEVIKELVIHACNKYKVSIPGKYIHVAKKKCIGKRKTYGKVDRPSFQGETTLKINDLISAYHSHLENDIFYQMSNMVQSAIANFNQTKDETEIPLEVVDHSCAVDNVIDVANDYTNENDPKKTHQDQNETVVEAVENNEYNLFNDSSDGETHAEELLPKKNPKFDEKTHDIKQLYIKPTDAPDDPVIKLNPKLFKVIDQKIEAEKNPDLIAPGPKGVRDRSDSEEDVCLSILQEQKLIRQKLYIQAKRTKSNNVKLLIPSVIPSYKYWIRQYQTHLASLPMMNQRFANEIDATLPKNFVFVLRECADVVGYPPFNLYKSLQRVEGCLKDKFVDRKRLFPSYIVKNKKRFRCNPEF